MKSSLQVVISVCLLLTSLVSAGTITISVADSVVVTREDNVMTVTLSNAPATSLIVTASYDWYSGPLTFKPKAEMTFGPGETVKTVTFIVDATGTMILIATPTGGVDKASYTESSLKFPILRRISFELPDTPIIVGDTVTVTVILALIPAPEIVVIVTRPTLATFGGADSVTLNVGRDGVQFFNNEFYKTDTSQTFTMLATKAGEGFLNGTVNANFEETQWKYRIVPKYFMVEKPKVTLTVSSSTATVGNAVDVTITLQKEPPNDLTVTLSTTPEVGTFTGIDGAVAHFVRGGSLTTMKTLLTTASSIDGVVNVTLSGTDAAEYKPTTVQLRVLRKVSFTVSSPSVATGAEINVTISIDEASTVPLQLMLSTVPTLGTFPDGLTSTTITFAPGQKSHSVPLKGGTSGTGIVIYRLSGSNRYNSTQSITLTVLRKVTLSLSLPTVVVGSSADVKIELSDAPASDLQVTLSTTLGTFNGGETLTIPAGQTSTEKTLITTKAGTSDITINLTGTDAALYDNDAKISLTVLRKVTLSVTQQNVYMDRGIEVTITLSDMPSTDITIALLSSIGTFANNGEVTFLSTDGISKTIVLTVPTVTTTTVTATLRGGDALLYSTSIDAVSLNVLPVNFITLSLAANNIDATGPWVRVQTATTLTLNLSRSLGTNETMSVKLKYGAGGDEVTFHPNPVVFGAGVASQPVTVTGVTAHAEANITMTVQSGPEDSEVGPALALRVCSGAFSCPDGTCSTTGSLSGCACTADAVITNETIVSTPVPITVKDVKELIASNPITLTVSAAYRGGSGACSDFNFSPYMTVQWSLVPQQAALIDSIVSNRTTIIFPAKHFTPDTAYTLRATLTPLIGPTVSVNFEFKAVAPVPILTMKALYRKVGPRNVQLLASIVDPYADPSEASWSCTGICGTALMSALSSNGTMTGVFLSGPLEAGTSYLTMSYKGVTSAELVLEVSETEIPVVTIVPSVLPAVAPATYLSTQPLVLAASVKFPTSTSLSWTVNGEAMDTTTKLLTVPMDMLFAGGDNTITVTATGLNTEGTEVYGEGRLTFFVAAEQTVTITVLENVNGAGLPLSAGVHSVQVTYTASDSGTSGTTSFVVGYQEGNTKVVMLTTGSLSATFVCPIVNATELRVYVDMLINGHRVATHTLDYVVELPEPAALVSQLTQLMSAATSPVDKARVALQAASVLGRGDAEQQASMLNVVLDGLASADPTTVDPITAFGAAKAARLSAGSGEALNAAVLSLAAKYASTATVDSCGAMLSELASVPGSAGVAQQVGQGLAKGTEVGGPPVNCVADDGTGRAVVLTSQALSPDDLSSDALSVGEGTTVSLPSIIGTFAEGANVFFTGMLLPPSAVSTASLASEGLQLVIYENNAVKNISGLVDPITFWIRSSFPQYDDCMYYDEANDEWSSAGVTKIDWSDTSIHCATTHLTTFGSATGSSAAVVRLSLLTAVTALLLQVSLGE